MVLAQPENKMKYKYLFFDLDGTLVDTTQGVIDSFNYALKHFGHAEIPQSEQYKYMGPPLQYSFQNFAGLSIQDSQDAVNLYRKRYSEVGIDKCEIFPEIPSILSKAKEKGYSLAVATSKNENEAFKVLDKYNLTKYFDCISGSSSDGRIESKKDVIIQALKRLGISDYNSVLMIGDRKYDIIGAKECKIDSAGIYTGYAEENELENASATFTFKSLKDFYNYL